MIFKHSARLFERNKVDFFEFTCSYIIAKFEQPQKGFTSPGTLAPGELMYLDFFCEDNHTTQIAERHL